MHHTVHPFPFPLPFSVLSCHFCGKSCGSAEGYRVGVAYGVALYVRVNAHGEQVRVLCPMCYGKFDLWVRATTKVFAFHSCLH